MPNLMRCTSTVAASVAVILASLSILSGQGKPMCDPDNGGITAAGRLLRAGGRRQSRRRAPHGRGRATATSTWRCMTSGGRGQPRDRRRRRGAARRQRRRQVRGGRALRHRAARPASRIRNGYVYLAHPLVDRALQAHRRAAEAHRAPPRRSSRGFPTDRQHEDKGIAFDGRGGLYVNVGAPSNACQNPDRRPGVKGVDPCPLLERTPASGSSTRTSRTRRTTRARGSRPACARCRRSPGTTARSSSR